MLCAKQLQSFHYFMEGNFVNGFLRLSRNSEEGYYSTTAMTGDGEEGG